MHSTSISFIGALLINLNIIIGTGLFINSGALIERASIYGALSYVLVGIMLLPIVISLALLLKKNPGATFYQLIGNNTNTFWGFIGTWIYFFAKQNSAVAAIYVFSTMTQEIFFNQILINNTLLTIALIVLFTISNTRNMKTGLYFQNFLMLSKALLISIITLSGLYFFNLSNITHTAIHTPNILSTIPLVLFSLLGFESICSVNMHINKNIPMWKIIITSYFVTIATYVVYQTSVLSLIGNDTSAITSFKNVFSTIAFTLTHQTRIPHVLLAKLFYLCVAFSALSGGYGILYANQWNLYTLGTENSCKGSQYLVIKNSYSMPYVASFIQCISAIMYVIISQEQLFVLQQMSAFGCSLTYLLTTCALMAHRHTQSKIIGFFGLLSSSLLLAACINNFLQNGFFAMIIFLGIILIGIALYQQPHPKRTP